MAHDTGIIASFTTEPFGVRADVIRRFAPDSESARLDTQEYCVIVIDLGIEPGDPETEVGRVYRRREADAIAYAKACVSDVIPAGTWMTL